MNVFAIISEYNPLHNGHIYQIKLIKKHFPDAKIVIFMSGSFVQRGEPAFINKYYRAKSAIKNGADLVLEMPTIISLQSAKFFSEYSIKILQKLNIITHLCFGVENYNKNGFLDEIKEIKSKFNIINETQKKFIDSGFSFKSAFEKSIKQVLNKKSSFISNPNNTLGLEYMMAIDKFNSNIIPFPITRIDKGYHNDKIDDSMMYQSASAIRNAVLNNIDISNYVSDDMNFLLKNSKIHNIDELSDIFYFEAFVYKKNGQNIAGYENGILNLIMKNYDGKISTTIEKSKNKRYSKSRLKRFILNYLLDITNTDIKNLEHINYIRPLFLNKNGAKILKNIDGNNIKIINKLNDIKDLDEINKKYLELDIKAYKLFNINDLKINNLDYTNNPFIKEI